MNLEELLEHTSKDFLDDRTDLLDGEPDELWSDTVLVRYFNEAQRILCRRAWVIRDVGQAKAGVIVLATGKSVYPIHKSVLRVHDVTPEDQDYPLTHHDDVALRTPRPYTDDFYQIDNVTTPSTGRPLGYSTDAGSRLMRIFRTPSSVENGLRLIMQVTRYPVCMLEVGKTGESPEVPEDYHMWLCDYAAGRCLSHPNVDGQAKAEARELLAEFQAHVKEARQDRQRAEMSNSRWSFASATSVLR